MASVELLTVGHGTLSADRLAALLGDAHVALLVDVRSYPGSRRHPQFGREQLERWLPDAGIDYRWERRLGGRRTVSPDSPHVALHNDAFRAYADHMGTADFNVALDEVLASAAERRTAVMCAESVWWRCHRRLLADAVVLTRDGTVRHLFHDGRSAPHAVTDGARVVDGAVLYDLGGDASLPL
ncbi:MAG: DUF488 family protein [Acidimicrobiales bacterium]